MKKKIQNILLIGSIAVLFCFTSCNTKVNPDIPKTPETEDTLENTTTPSDPEPSEDKKPLGFEICIADNEVDYGVTEVIFEEKTDNTIIETRITTYKDGRVKTSVITSKPDATKTIVETYSSGEKFEAEIAVNGSSSVKAYKNGEEIELKNYVFWDNKGYAGQYNCDLQLADYFTSKDLIKGDVLHVKYYGFAKTNFENISCVVASGGKEDNWYLALSDYYSLEPMNNINKNSSFVLNKDIPITKTSASDFKDLKLFNYSKYLSTESSSNHPESKDILAYITIEIDDTNRIPEAVINYETDGGILKTDDNKVYPGRYITATAEKPGLLFKGWFDGPEKDAEPVTKCPETEGPITVYAHWIKITANYGEDISFTGGSSQNEYGKWSINTSNDSTTTSKRGTEIRVLNNLLSKTTALFNISSNTKYGTNFVGLLFDVTSHKSDTNKVLYDFGVLALGSNSDVYPEYYVSYFMNIPEDSINTSNFGTSSMRTEIDTTVTYPYEIIIKDITDLDSDAFTQNNMHNLVAVFNESTDGSYAIDLYNENQMNSDGTIIESATKYDTINISAEKIGKTAPREANIGVYYYLRSENTLSGSLQLYEFTK